MNNKSMRTLGGILIVLIVVAFAATKLQFRTSEPPNTVKDAALNSEQPTDPSERIDRLETHLVIANAQHLVTKINAMSKASAFFDAMSKKLSGDITESACQIVKSELDEAKMDLEQASDKARSLYLELKELDPGNKTLAETRDAGRVKGGVSPYDD